MNEDKIQDISAVKEFTNYKKLCFALGEKTKTGCSKKAQIKEWSRYFKFHKEGYKIIIDEKYNIPYPKEDDRYRNGKHTYTGDVEIVLMEYLSQEFIKGRASSNISKTGLLSLFGIVNEAYKKSRNNIKQSSIIMKTDINVTKDILRKLGKTGGDAIESALYSLDKREDFYISFTKEITLIILEEDEDEDEEEKITDKPTCKFIIADADKVAYIKEVEKDAFEQLNIEFNKKRRLDNQIKIEHKGNVFCYGLKDRFDKIIEPKIFAKFGAIGYYDSYNFEIDDSFIFYSSIDVTSNKDNIRNNVLNSINTYVKNRINNYSDMNKVAEKIFVNNSKRILKSVMFEGEEYNELIEGLFEIQKEMKDKKDKIQDVKNKQDKLFAEEQKLENDFLNKYIDVEKDFKSIKGKTQQQRDWEDADLFG